MKKWMYVIFPGIMLGLFLIVYTTHVKEAERKEQERIVKMEAQRKEEAEKKKKNEEAAAADAKKRQEEREAEERKKEADRRRKQEAADQDVRDRTAKARAEGDTFAKTVSQEEVELDRLHKQRDQLSRETFELSKAVEADRVAKRNAELQQQHLTEMLANRAASSPMAQVPPPPPAK
jgi:hypothetical protein